MIITIINNSHLYLFKSISFFPNLWKSFVIKHKDCKKTPLFLIILLSTLGYITLYIGILSHLPSSFKFIFSFIILLIISSPFFKLLEVYGFKQFKNRRLENHFKQDSILDKEYNNNPTDNIEKELKNISEDFESINLHNKKDTTNLKKDLNELAQKILTDSQKNIQSINTVIDDQGKIISNLNLYTKESIKKHQNKINTIEHVLKINTKKILFSNKIRNHDLKNLFLNYFKKHIKNIDGIKFLLECTNYPEIYKLKTITPSHISVKITTSERKDLLAFINQLKHEGLIENGNTHKNSNNSIAKSLIENYPNITFGLNTIVPELNGEKNFLNDMLYSDFKYYLK